MHNTHEFNLIFNMRIFILVIYCFYCLSLSVERQSFKYDIFEFSHKSSVRQSIYTGAVCFKSSVPWQLSALNFYNSRKIFVNTSIFRSSLISIHFFSNPLLSFVKPSIFSQYKCKSRQKYEVSLYEIAI